MNKKFCQKCNGITYYEDELPNVCCKCSKPFASTVLANIKPSITLELEENEDVELEQKSRQKFNKPNKFKPKMFGRRRETEENEDNYEDDDTPPETDLDFDSVKLEIEQFDNARQKTTLGQLAQDRGPKEKIQRQGKIKKISKKQFEEIWQNDFKGGRQNSQEIGIGGE